jgi:Na+-translocating ferredoxin:NAD+ oxidoreductase subunit B
MAHEMYERLADALNRLPNGFPRTPSSVEVQLLARIFSPEEASAASQLTGEWETLGTIAPRLGLPVNEARSILVSMVKRGLLWFDKKDNEIHFRLAPFIVGIYEAQVETMDAELAQLFEKYMEDGGVVGIMKPQPALHRVVPAQGTVKSEQVLPYDDVRAILLSSKSFNVRDCVCRVQQDHIGRECSFPTKMCLSFSDYERSPRPDDISQAEALAILNQAEEIGLVHTVSNVMKGVGYVCNCCGCCCGILRGITDWGIENSVAFANYFAVIDPITCTGCGTCITRCQVHAISELNGISVVARSRCIGCGLCVSGCPSHAATLQLKPESEIIHPPEDYPTWEHQRLDWVHEHTHTHTQG